MRVQSLGWKIPQRMPWQPTPVFFPGESHGQMSLTGYSPQDHKELDTHTHTHQGKKLKFHPSMGIHLMTINQVAYMCMIPLFLHSSLTVKTRGNGTHIMV